MDGWGFIIIFKGGWYDLETLEFKFLEDITFIAAMGPPS